MKPRVALVPHTRAWSYDFTAQALVQHLSDRFEFSVFYSDQLDQVSYRNLDLIVDFWWRSGLDRRYGARVIKQVSSHRWARPKYGSLSAELLISEYLRRAGGVIVPSVRLVGELVGAPHLTLGPKGFHPETFGDEQNRRGDLAVGWAGNANATDKRLAIIAEAWRDLRVASTLTQGEMPGFYNSIDVITCASDAEGDPRPLIEGMACGCFPVTVDVGIVPELVQHGANGLIVERTPEAFKAALRWCRANLEFVREAGRRNAVEMARTRTWRQSSQAWGDVFEAAIARAPEWPVRPREERKARILAARKRRAKERAERDYEAARSVRSLDELELMGVAPDAPWPPGFETEIE